MKHLITTILLAFMSSAIFAQTATVTLDGSASSDSDGTVTAYKWVQISGPATPTFNATSAKTTVTYTVAGIYKYTLTVTDNQGATNTGAMTVTVLPVNLPPKAIITVTDITVQLK